MDISVNTNKVKDTKDEEHSVTDNSNIEVINTLGNFKLFECGKFFQQPGRHVRTRVYGKCKGELLVGNV